MCGHPGRSFAKAPERGDPWDLAGSLVPAVWPEVWSGGRVEANGTRLNVRVLDADIQSESALVLLHGSGANGAWWRDVAPALARNHTVYVPDLSGHAGSEWPGRYGVGRWVAELAALIRHLDHRRVHLVGHSMGGRLATVLVADHPHLVDALVVVDSFLRPPRLWRLEPRMAPTMRTFATAAEAVTAFRLRPPETRATPELLDFVARSSVRRTGDRWTWGFDPATVGKVRDDVMGQALSRVDRIIGFVYGERSRFDPQVVSSYVAAASGHRPACIEVADAYHHVMLDDPPACAAAIAALLDRVRG